MTKEIEYYANSINASQEIIDWLKTTGRKALIKKTTTTSELEHIVDFLNSNSAPKRLRKMSFKDANKKSIEWAERNKKKGRNLVDNNEDIEIVHDFKNGCKIVLLKTKKAYQREGFFMNHCVGGYSSNDNDCLIYSYRDKNNEPHATFEVRKNANEIVQIKGKGNGDIHPRYIQPVLTFLKIIGMDIRPNDMENLGYYHINKVHFDFLMAIPGAKKQITEINGEIYAH